VRAATNRAREQNDGALRERSRASERGTSVAPLGCGRRLAMKLVRTIAALLFVSSAACGGSGNTSQRTATSSANAAHATSTTQLTAADRMRASGHAHRLVIDATGCWFGAIWRDALGEDGRSRCADVLKDAYGRVDTDRIQRLRALDYVEVRELRSYVWHVAIADPQDQARAEPLIRMFDGIVSTQRETMSARRAADRVKMDVSGERTRGNRFDDERAAVAPLSAFDANRALYALDAGELSAEARAIAILCAMDRMSTANGLPKHLKVYAVRGAYGMLFGVEPPEVPSDPTKPMKAGRWLAYISEVARAAGHPVPPEAKTLQGREMMAWSGALEGIADKLRVEEPKISSETDLQRAVRGAVRKIDTEYREAQAAVMAAQGAATP
jgi:hypothetical protein